mgnify:CR=1 FL=1
MVEATAQDQVEPLGDDDVAGQEDAGVVPAAADIGLPVQPRRVIERRVEDVGGRRTEGEVAPIQIVVQAPGPLLTGERIDALYDLSFLPPQGAPGAPLPEAANATCAASSPGLE